MKSFQEYLEENSKRNAAYRENIRMAVSLLKKGMSDEEVAIRLMPQKPKNGKPSTKAMKLVSDAKKHMEDGSELAEEIANSVAGGGVDMNTTGVVLPKRDRRKKEDCDNMYRRAQGLSGIKHLLKEK